MGDFIQGKCLLMCPEKERRMREREKLLHLFEVDEASKGQKRPKADPNKIVKCYGRPAIGQDMTDATELRPASVLLLTVKYLLSEVVVRRDVNWVVVYDYIFDRLRAVRQDIAIQRIPTNSSVALFEHIIRFLVYSGQRLCERTIADYDPKINSQHLSECIKHVLFLYDQLEKQQNSLDVCLSTMLDTLSLDNNRPEMEALYLLLYIGDVEALERGLRLSSCLRESWLVKTALKISLAWHLRNYVRVFKLIESLPPLLECAALMNLATLRRITFQIMSTAYNSKVLTYPGTKLQELLLYKDIKKLQQDCEHYGLKLINQNVQFQKATFNATIKLANSERYFKEEVLHNSLPFILLEPI